jgi:hypothetical protein
VNEKKEREGGREGKLTLVAVLLPDLRPYLHSGSCSSIAVYSSEEKKKPSVMHCILLMCFYFLLICHFRRLCFCDSVFLLFLTVLGLKLMASYAVPLEPFLRTTDQLFCSLFSV